MKTLKIFLSKITRPRGLIFGLQHHLVDLYQVCSNNAPGDKNGPTTRVTFYIGLKAEVDNKRQSKLLFSHFLKCHQYDNIYSCSEAISNLSRDM